MTMTRSRLSSLARRENFLPNGVAYLLIALFFALERALRTGQEARSLEHGPFDRQSSERLGRAYGLAGSMLLLAPLPNLARIGHARRATMIGWSGVGLMVGGILVRVWANTTLGTFYTRTLRVAEGQRLVEHGPYRLVRHPGYSGSLLLWSGAGLASANWLVSIVVTDAMLSAYRYRIKIEEAMLDETFGVAYGRYRRRTWKLIPYLY